MAKTEQRIEVDLEQVLPFTGRKFIEELSEEASACGYDLDFRVTINATLTDNVGEADPDRLKAYLEGLNLEGLPFGVRGDMSLY